MYLNLKKLQDSLQQATNVKSNQKEIKSGLQNWFFENKMINETKGKSDNNYKYSRTFLS